MPLFEYKCGTCSHVFDSYSSKAPGAPSRPCPQCGEKAPKVPVSRPAKRNPDHGIQR